jgi:hypothetical protein
LLNQALEVGLHCSPDGLDILATQSVQPVGMNKPFQQCPARHGINRACQDFGAKFRQQSSPLPERLVKLACQLVANGLGEQGGSPTCTDGDQELSTAQRGGDQKITAGRIIGGINPDHFPLCIGNHELINLGRRGGEDEGGAFQMG